MTIRANKRRFAIGFYLLSGFTVWGVDLDGRAGREQPRLLSNCGKGDWIMCCGHVLKTAEVREWREAGLLAEGPPDKFGRATVIAGPKLEQWVDDAWHNLAARTWGPRS